ncbi:MAG: hypothetical protein AAF479_10065 [Pseudomonadota bacterium]
MPRTISFFLAAIPAVILSACAPQQAAVEPKSSPALDAAAAEGARYTMDSLIGIGDIVITPDAMVTSDGQRLPIQSAGDGVWAFLEPPSRLTNGEDFCFSKPVTFFTWHQRADGLFVMNVGDWPSPPPVPDANSWDTPGGCGLSTYKPTPGAS